MKDNIIKKIMDKMQGKEKEEKVKKSVIKEQEQKLKAIGVRLASSHAQAIRYAVAMIQGGYNRE